jgi:hypothetical protein
MVCRGLVGLVEWFGMGYGGDSGWNVVDGVELDREEEQEPYKTTLMDIS